MLEICECMCVCVNEVAKVWGINRSRELLGEQLELPSCIAISNLVIPNVICFSQFNFVLLMTPQLIHSVSEPFNLFCQALVLINHTNGLALKVSFYVKVPSVKFLMFCKSLVTHSTNRSAGAAEITANFP